MTSKEKIKLLEAHIELLKDQVRILHKYIDLQDSLRDPNKDDSEAVEEFLDRRPLHKINADGS